MFMRDNILTKIRTEEYYKEAMRNLRAHPGAVQLLGEPIKELGFDLEDKENETDGKYAFFKVRVKGPNDRGTMYFWADRPEFGAKWNVNRIELELKDQPDRRLVVKKPAEN